MSWSADDVAALRVALKAHPSSSFSDKTERFAAVSAALGGKFGKRECHKKCALIVRAPHTTRFARSAHHIAAHLRYCTTSPDHLFSLLCTPILPVRQEHAC